MSTRSRHSQPPLDPRKTPRQERSRVTVDAILEATARILVREGMEALTTARVTREAGVAVGSMYQYFPSKDALLMALIDRHACEMKARFEATFVTLGNEPLPALVRALVHAFVESHRVNPTLHRVLMLTVPRLGGARSIESVKERVEALATAYLAASAHAPSDAQAARMAFVLVHAIEGAVDTAVRDRPEFLDASLVDELVALTLGYVSARASLHDVRTEAPKRDH